MILKFLINRKPLNPFIYKTLSGFKRLSDQDSNLDRQNQNLQCYHYTIGQRKAPQMYRKISLNPNYLSTGSVICLQTAFSLP